MLEGEGNSMPRLPGVCQVHFLGHAKLIKLLNSRLGEFDI